jgi:hypothetical protein
LEPQIAGEDACPVVEPIQDPGFPLVNAVVDDGAGKFRVMGPGTKVDVVGADRGQHIVNDTNLGCT